MMVNAAEFPGPAIWQAVMLLALPAWAIFAFLQDGKYFARAVTSYIAFGVVLLVVVLEVTGPAPDPTPHVSRIPSHDFSTQRNTQLPPKP